MNYRNKKMSHSSVAAYTLLFSMTLWRSSQPARQLKKMLVLEALQSHHDNKNNAKYLQNELLKAERKLLDPVEYATPKGSRDTNTVWMNEKLMSIT